MAGESRSALGHRHHTDFDPPAATCVGISHVHSIFEEAPRESPESGDDVAVEDVIVSTGAVVHPHSGTHEGIPSVVHIMGTGYQ